MAVQLSIQVQGRSSNSRGTTRLRFDERGRVTLHRDYWDPAQGVHEKLPAIGSVARWLRARPECRPLIVRVQHKFRFRWILIHAAADA